MMSALSPPTTPRPNNKDVASSPTKTKPTSSINDFDIVSHYNRTLAKDESLTPPIAAIESLISVLSSSSLTTISETLDLLSSQSALLLSSQSNPIPLSAGTDLFQRYLIASFQQRSSSSSLATSSDFNVLRKHLITNAKLFVERAKQARSKIAHHALPFIKDDSTVFIFGHDLAVIKAVLNQAVKSGRYFHVIQIDPSSSQSSINLPQSIPTHKIPMQAFTYTLSSLPSTTKQSIILLGASSVLENGSIISQMGTHQLCILASTFNIPVHVAVESYTFVRNFPLGCGKAELERMGVKQEVLSSSSTSSDDGIKKGVVEGNDDNKNKRNLIEITPPKLISAIITENGVMTPNAVSEELIKLWF